MGVRRLGCFVLFAIFICTLAAVGSGERKRAEELFLAHGIDPATCEIDENMAELPWINCRLDLIHLNAAVEDFDFSVRKETISSSNEIILKSQSSAKANVLEAVNVLHPQIKQILFDCLRKKNLVYYVSGEEEGSKKWYNKYLESLFRGPAVPVAARRILVGESPKSIAETPASGPDAGSPSPSTAPSSDTAPSSSKRSSLNPPQAPQTSFFPPDIGGSGLEPSAGGHSSSSSASGPSVQTNKHSNKKVVVAVVVTASVTFVVVAVLFLCCSKCRTGSGIHRNDERPLLSLSLSDFSVGSSPKPFAFENSINQEKFGNQSFTSNSNHKIRTHSGGGNFYLESDTLNSSVAVASSVGVVAGVGQSSVVSSGISSSAHTEVLPPLKLPPGMVVSTSPGPPSLKHPMGMGDLPPPDASSFLKPPPGKAAPPPPPPPPPVAPSSIKPSSGSAGRPPLGTPPPPPTPPGNRPGSQPPLPPKTGLPPPRPPQPMAMGSKLACPSLGPSHASNSDSLEADAPKTKLKPFFWDKVLANPDHSMVWHQIKSGSFQFNEEMIETLFGYAPPNKDKKDCKKESTSQDLMTQYIQLIDSKKAQNLSILLRALNVTTEEVCDALQEGNELPVELLETLLKMAPTAEEELKLRLFSGELSQLGPAERFLKVLVNIPFAFKRLESLLFMGSLQEEVSTIKESFSILEVACKELRNCRLFLKLLEAVLKTGNRMNDGTFRGGAQAFKLDTLLKLSDVKGTDGKTTLLHFVVQEIIRSEGIRAARAARESQSFSSIKSDDLLEDTSHDSEDNYRSLGLQVVSGLGSELENVKKAAILDADSLAGTVAKLGHALIKSRDFLNSDMKNLDENSGFHQTLKSFVQHAEVDIMWLLEEEKRVVALVKTTADYFHGNAGKDEGLRLFTIVRDFLIMLDKVCKEVRDSQRKPTRTQKIGVHAVQTSSESRQPPSPDLRHRLFPAIAERRIDSSSSDDESP